MGSVSNIGSACHIPTPDHFDNRDVELAGKIPVSLVSARHGHNRPGSIGEQDIIGDPDRNGLSIGGIQRIAAGVDPGLFFQQFRAGQVGLAQRLFFIGLNYGPIFRGGDALNQGMFRGQDTIGRAKQRIRARGKDVEKGVFLREQGAIAVAQLETNAGALTPPDPVALHFLDIFRPIELVESGQQPFRIGRDTEHPLPHGPADDLMSTALTLTVDDFFVGQDRAQGRTPVDRHLCHIGQTALVQFEENPLRPAIVVGITGRNLPVPIVGKAQGLDLTPKGRDIAGRCFPRVRTRLNRILFRGQSERVPAHGMQDIQSPHALVTGQDIGCGIAFRVSDVQSGGTRIREHVQDVVFLLLTVDLGAKSLVFKPVTLPFRLDDIRLIAHFATCGRFRRASIGLFIRETHEAVLSSKSKRVNICMSSGGHVYSFRQRARSDPAHH